MRRWSIPQLQRALLVLIAGLTVWSTGLAPVVGQQITVNGQNLGQRLARLELLTARAEAGDGDLVVSGILQGEARGMFYLGEGIFQTDRKDEGISWQEMLETVEAGGALLTFTVVPPGSAAASSPWRKSRAVARQGHNRWFT